MRPSTRAFCVASIACALALVSAALPGLAPSSAPAAQGRSRRLDSELEKNGSQMRALFAPVVRENLASVARLIDDRGRELALGTVVDANGLILTKASSIDAFDTVLLHDGRRLAGRVVGVADDHDLALIQLDVGELAPVEWDLDEPQLGQWLITPGGRSETPVGLGVAGLASRRILPRSGLLGVVLANRIEAIVEEVQRGSGAEVAGILPGDWIESIDGQFVAGRRDLIERIANLRVGKRVIVGLQRGTQPLELEVTLGARDASPDSEQLGGLLSPVRSGFPLALQHDTPLDPRQCGGPLLDSAGKTRAINIARASRTETYAIPAREVLRILPDLRSGRLAPLGGATSARREPAPKGESF